MTVPRPTPTPTPTRLSHAVAPRGVATLRVATWNLRHCGGSRTEVGLDRAAALIAASGADVVAVQEVDRWQHRSGRTDQVTELADRLGWHSSFAATMVGSIDSPPPVSPDRHGGPAYGIGLLSRCPLAACTTWLVPPVVDPASGAEPRIVLRTAVVTAVGSVGIVSTHLSWRPMTALRQVRSVIEYAAGEPGPVIVLGDLNLPRRWVRRVLRGSEWCAAGARPTFPAAMPLLQLDHVLVRGAVPTAVSVGPAGPSDHRMVSAVVVLTGGRDRSSAAILDR